MLRVTKLTDYATVVMTVLAKSGTEVLSATGIAQRSGLEIPTVSKVLKPLAQAGLVESYRGTHGGYRLSRSPEQISLLEIVEVIEGPLAMTACSDHGDACDLSASCDAAGNWQWVNRVLAETLATISLAGMLERHPDRTIAAADRRRISAVLQDSGTTS